MTVRFRPGEIYGHLPPFRIGERKVPSFGMDAVVAIITTNFQMRAPTPAATDF
jgi:hypothetical protein